MPETATVTITGLTANQDLFTEILSLTGAGIERVSPSVAVAKTGTLTTRTDNDTGTFTMTTGHGFSTADKIDVFWSGGQRRAMDATVTGDSVVLDGGSGDNLPAQTTAITAMKPVTVAFTVVGNTAFYLGVSSPVPGYIVFVDNAAAEIAAATYSITPTGGGGKSWATNIGFTNPLAGATTSLVKFSHSSSTAARTMKAVVIHTTPP